jgi:hypothetical protein
MILVPLSCLRLLNRIHRLRRKSFKWAALAALLQGDPTRRVEPTEVKKSGR